MGNENTQPIKTAEEILDQMLSKQVLVKKIGQEPFNEALEAINQLLIEAKMEQLNDVGSAIANGATIRTLAVDVSSLISELQQSLKENK